MKEEEERKRKKEEARRKKVILEAAFDGDKKMIENVLDEVNHTLICQFLSVSFKSFSFCSKSLSKLSGEISDQGNS